MEFQALTNTQTETLYFEHFFFLKRPQTYEYRNRQRRKDRQEARQIDRDTHVNKSVVLSECLVPSTSVVTTTFCVVVLLRRQPRNYENVTVAACWRVHFKIFREFLSLSKISETGCSSTRQSTRTLRGVIEFCNSCCNSSDYVLLVWKMKCQNQF